MGGGLFLLGVSDRVRFCMTDYDNPFFSPKKVPKWASMVIDVHQQQKTNGDESDSRPSSLDVNAMLNIFSTR